MLTFFTAFLGAMSGLEPISQVSLGFPLALAVVGGVMIAGGLYSAYKGLSDEIPTFESQQPELFDQLQQEAQGKFSGPFIADVAREQALQRIQAQSFGLAVSQRGVSPALALQQAQAAQGKAAVETAGQTAVLRVQEQLSRTESAREALFAAEGQERENALQKRQLTLQLAGGLISGGAAVAGAGLGAGGGETTQALAQAGTQQAAQAITPQAPLPPPTPPPPSGVPDTATGSFGLFSRRQGINIF